MVAKFNRLKEVVGIPIQWNRQRASRARLRAAMNEMITALERIGALDFSVSIPQLGSLFRYAPDTPLGRDQHDIAQIYGVKLAWPGSNGTTALNAMAVSALARPGDKVLVQRDSHVSLYAPAIQIGLRLCYLRPHYSHDLGINLGVTTEQLEQALAEHPDIKLVVLTYPNYWGVATDIDALARILRAHAIPLIIDSAHGAYLRFHPDLPLAAEETRAAIVTQSTHKTCGAISQGSLALVSDEEVASRFYEVINQLGYVSTSFSYPIIQSVILAVQQLHLHGEQLLGESIRVSNWLRNEINRVEGLSCFGEEQLQDGFIALDPMRVTVDVSRIGMSGLEAEQWLIDTYRIYPEMANLKNVLFLFTPSDGAPEAQLVLKAMKELARYKRDARAIPNLAPPGIPCQVMSPREVFFSRMRRTLPVEQAIGLPSAETIATYPPGSAVIVAGELITAEAVDFLRTVRNYGGVLKGASDPSFKEMMVVGE